MLAIDIDEALWGNIPKDIKTAIGYSLRGVGDCKVVLWGSGSPFREFLYVDDMANACSHVMFNSDTIELLNIGTGRDITIFDMAKVVAEVVGYEGDIIWDQSKPDGTPRKLLDVDKMNENGWKSTIALRDGLMRMYLWYQNKGK